jgi:hypothetical protein
MGLNFKLERLATLTSICHFPAGFQKKSLIAVPCPFHPLLFDHKNYEVPRCGIFSSLLSLRLSPIEIFSSAPYSQTPSILVLPINFNTQTKQQIQLYSKLLGFWASSIVRYSRN